jgi:hypothetical protein
MGWTLAELDALPIRVYHELVLYLNERYEAHEAA